MTKSMALSGAAMVKCHAICGTGARRSFWLTCLNGPVGRMIAAVMLGLAESELEYRRERQAAGIQVAKKKGSYKGRKKGTTKSKPGRAKELRDKGLTVAEIAQALGVSERTAFRYFELLAGN